MTVIIGAHLGDGVGIAGDTRVSLDSGTFRDDALKIYQFPPFFIAGITGDAWSAVVLLTEFYIRYFMNIPREEGFRKVVDGEWVRTNLNQVYEDLRDCQSHRFGLILASDDTLFNLNPGASRTNLMDVVAVHSSSFSDSVKKLTRSDSVSGKRLLFSISFPDGDTLVASQGQVISAGSGSIYESLLLAKTNVTCAFQLSLGDRFAALSGDIERLAELATDTSFNGFSVGMALGRSDISLTLHGYHRWPLGSRPEDYTWEPADPDIDGFPYTIPYSVGMDQREIDAAWIFKGNFDNPRDCQKLRLESYRKPEFIDKYRGNEAFRFKL